jgi:hypothetical protein
MSKLQKKPAAHKRGHPTLQNMNFKKICLLLLVIFALLDPDPLARSNPDRIRIRNPALDAPDFILKSFNRYFYRCILDDISFR